MTLHKIISYFFISLSFVLVLRAQNSKFRFDIISLEQGLSQSTVYAIAQDKQGFIWFGTQDGLNRYDGYSINVFKHDPVDSSSISDNIIWSLLCDKVGDLWVGTMNGGLDRYVISENKFHHYKFREDSKTSISSNYITCLFEGSDGDIWIGTYNGGLNRFNRKTNSFTRFKYDKKDKNSLSSNTVWALCEDQSGNLWIATSHGVSEINTEEKEKENSIKFTQYLNNPSQLNSLSSNNVHSVYVDNSGFLWIGTWDKGISKYNIKLKTFTHYSNIPQKGNSLSVNSIQSIYQDYSGRLWIASADGNLMTYDEKTDIFTHYPTGAVATIFEDRSHILWMGTFTSGAISYDQRKHQFQHYYYDPDNLSSINSNVIITLLEDKDEELWVGTLSGGLNHLDKQRRRIATYTNNSHDKHSISSNRILSICESRDGSLWIGTEGGGLNKFNKSTKQFTRYINSPSNSSGIAFNEVTALCEDRSGNLWIGGNTGKIDILKSGSNTFTHLLNGKDNPLRFPVTLLYEGKDNSMWAALFKSGAIFNLTSDSSGYKLTQPFHDVKLKNPALMSLNNNVGFSIYEDKSGIIWIGTYGGGLFRYNPSVAKDKKNFLINYTTKDGLPNVVVYGILPDKSGNLWLSTNKGISRFNPSKEIFRNYDLKDGLQGNEFNQGAYFVSKRGEMFFGGINGFNSFFPDRIKDNGFIPPVYLTSFKIFDEPLHVSGAISEIKNIVLSYAQNFFSFEFVALNFTSPEKNKYSYMLEGFEKDWHTVTAQQRYASYTNLEPGEYTLFVKGSNNDGIWNEAGTSVKIIVTPPFWKTWWFISLAWIFLIAVLIFTIRFFVRKNIREKTTRLEREAAIERERLRIARDMHDDLGAKVTQISILSELAKRDIRTSAVQNHIDAISLTAHKIVYALDEIVWAVNPKNDTLERLIDYLIQHIEQFLSHGKIDCRLDIPSEMPQLNIASDTRHNLFMVVQEVLNNILKHACASEAKIHMSLKGTVLFIKIQDNGKGFIPEKVNGFSNGLINMHRRIEEIKGVFTINSKEGEGTEVIMSVPLT